MKPAETESTSLYEALHYLEIGRYQQAESKLKELLTEAPNNGHLFYLMAICRYSLEKHQDALDHCQEALTHGFSEEECSYLLGRIDVALKKYAEAENNFLNALRLNPQKAETIASYGYLMFKTGHEKKAKLLLQEALQLEPYDETVLHYHFLIYLAQDNRIGQRNTLAQYIQSANNEVHKLVKIGLADLFSGKYQSAKDSFQQAFLLEPANENILGLLKEMEWKTNPFVRPLIWIEKIGGGPVLWLIFVPLAGLLLFLKLYTGVLIIAGSYLTICVYSWIIAGIRKFSMKNNQ